MASPEIERVKELYTAFQRRDSDELARLVAHDMEFEMPDGVPWGGVHHGQDGMAAVIELYEEHVDGRWADPEVFLEGGGRIVVLGRELGTVKATGASFEVEFAHVWGMAEGIPNRFRGYFDTAPITAALNAPEGNR